MNKLRIKIKRIQDLGEYRASWLKQCHAMYEAGLLTREELGYIKDKVEGLKDRLQEVVDA